MKLHLHVPVMTTTAATVVPGTTLEALCPNLCGTCGSHPHQVLLIVLAGYNFTNTGKLPRYTPPICSLQSANSSAFWQVTYLFSLLFRKHTRAQMITLIVNIPFVLLLLYVSVLLSSRGYQDLSDPECAVPALARLQRRQRAVLYLATCPSA